MGDPEYTDHPYLIRNAHGLTDLDPALRDLIERTLAEVDPRDPRVRAVRDLLLRIDGNLSLINLRAGR